MNKLEILKQLTKNKVSRGDSIDHYSHRRLYGKNHRLVKEFKKAIKSNAFEHLNWDAFDYSQYQESDKRTKVRLMNALFNGQQQRISY